MRSVSCCRVACVVALGLWAAEPARAKDALRDAVVKVYATQRFPDFVRPWTKAAPRECVGSGVVIEGRRILTNAHVVQYATQIFVQANGSPDKLNARLAIAGPDVDLALLQLDDESFFDQHPPLPLSDKLPAVKDKVTLYGYPIGGEQLSVTEGIISRMEYGEYAFSQSGLRLQVDAAINAGNSGGPAVIAGRLAGLVFCKLLKAENIGYVVPAEEIAMFLQDAADGTYDGRPRLHVWSQPVENEALRAKLGLDPQTGGALVIEVGSQDASSPLKVGDVIVQAGPHKLDKQGNAQIRDDLRMPIAYLVPKLVRDGKLPLTVLREGKSRKLQVPVDSRDRLLVPWLKGTYPRYFVHGPVVFMAASQELLQMPIEVYRYFAVMLNPLTMRQWQYRAEPDEELVILGTALLNDPMSKGYAPTMLAGVDEINGTRVRNLKHLVELLRDAQGEFLTVKLAGRAPSLVFRRADLEQNSEKILANEDIRSRGSEDLLKVWQAR